MNRLITPFVPYKHRIEEIGEYDLESKTLSKAEAEKYITKNSKILDIHIPNGIDIRNKTIGVFLYLGKIKNYLKAEDDVLDLLFYSYLHSLSKTLAKTNTNLFIIMENDFMDKYVLNIGSTYGKNKNAFHYFSYLYPNIKIKNMNDITKEICPEFMDVFDSLSPEVNKEGDVYKIFYNSIITNSFNETKNMSDKEKETRALISAKKYMAFIEGRKKVNYWEKIIKEYDVLRGTVSFKENIISLPPALNKIPIAHAVKKLDGEEGYLLDLYLDKKIKGRVMVNNHIFSYY